MLSARQKTVPRLAIVMVFLVIASMVGFTAYSRYAARDSHKNAEWDLSYPREISAEDHVMGRYDARTKLFVYLDVECPYCRILHQRTIPQLLAAYNDDLTIVYRHYPLRSRVHSDEGAEALECASESGGEAGFWKYLHRLYSTSRADGSFDLPLLSSVAKEIPEINYTAFEECRATRATRDRVRRDAVEGGVLGVLTTPSVLIVNGDRRVLVSGQSYARTKEAIDLVQKTGSYE